MSLQDCITALESLAVPGIGPNGVLVEDRVLITVLAALRTIEARVTELEAK